MGRVKIDTTTKERALDAKYAALDSPAGVKRLLRDYHVLVERAFDGDYDAVVLLVDLATAVELAGLTERQRECLRLVYGEDLTQEDAAWRLGISRQAVQIYIENAARKIAQIYEQWAWRGEGYSFKN